MFHDSIRECVTASQIQNLKTTAIIINTIK